MPQITYLWQKIAFQPGNHKQDQNPVAAQISHLQRHTIDGRLIVDRQDQQQYSVIFHYGEHNESIPLEKVCLLESAASYITIIFLIQ